jgi:GNAT superfamily N-acetyltransferase
LADKPELQQLIQRSARELSVDNYTSAQIEGALRGAFGVDTQLILDGTYFVAANKGKLLGCGGWSKRRTLFGGDTAVHRDAAELDPHIDAARIRAFFVDPDFARLGIGSAILDRCESEAKSRGFKKLELMATLPGVPLYTARGYVAGTPVNVVLRGSPAMTIEFVPMHKSSG